jgi:hypothetical protein
MSDSKFKKSHSVVFGIFDSKSALEGGVEILKNRGFRSSDISVLVPEKESSSDLGHQKSTKAPEGVTAGATTGVILGGGLGWLVGVGALSIPGVGPFLAAGPIVAALAGAGLVGAVGGVAGALIGMGIPEYEAKRYEGIVKKGGLLISIHVDNSEWNKLAKEILKTSGARDISTSRDIEGEDSPARDLTETQDTTPFL